MYSYFKPKPLNVRNFTLVCQFVYFLTIKKYFTANYKFQYDKINAPVLADKSFSLVHRSNS